MIEVAWDGYNIYPQVAAHQARRPGLRRSELRSLGRMVRGKHGHQARRAAAEVEAASKSRILLINGSSRSDQSCPGRDVQELPPGQDRQAACSSANVASTSSCSTSASHLGVRPQILPARPVYRRPCRSATGRAPATPTTRWDSSTTGWTRSIRCGSAAHGVMIVTPVNWYQAPAGTEGDDRSSGLRRRRQSRTRPRPAARMPKKAKALEMKGWDYPRHLAGRAFSVVVHGDAAGTETCAASWSTG